MTSNIEIRRGDIYYDELHVDAGNSVQKRNQTSIGSTE